MTELETQAAKPGLIWQNNPALMQLLGLSPLLAVSTSLAYGIGLGIATLCVCVLSCLTVSLVRRHISPDWRLLWFMLILASYTTVVDILTQLYFYPLYLRLGIYLPLICCNAAIVLRMETVARRSHWLHGAVDALKTGLGLLLALLLFSACRELLIGGTLLLDWQLLVPGNAASMTGAARNTGYLFRFADTQAGAFILLGLIVALINLISGGGAGHKTREAITPVKRARVTGRLIRDDASEASE